VGAARAQLRVTWIDAARMKSKFSAMCALYVVSNFSVILGVHFL